MRSFERRTALPLRAILIDRLLVEFIRHRAQDQADAFVDLAVSEIAAMFGVQPKLMWRAIHIIRDSPMLGLFRPIEDNQPIPAVMSLQRHSWLNARRGGRSEQK